MTVVQGHVQFIIMWGKRWLNLFPHRDINRWPWSTKGLFGHPYLFFSCHLSIPEWSCALDINGWPGSTFACWPTQLHLFPTICSL